MRLKSGIFIGLFFFFVISVELIAGTTGKIAGKVIDSETGEPLIGVNVYLQDKPFGAASDSDGFFTILNLPPGKYEVIASFIGYAEYRIQNVNVNTDRTTRFEIKLQTETLETEAVIVVAEREVVKADVATSVANVSAEEIETLPISSVSEIAGLQAGVESGLVIRGGDASQSLFQIDGAAMRDPRNNAPITGVALSAVQEVSIERGGFNAEYGQVRAGIINLVTKEGDRSNYNINVITKYSPPTRKYFGMSPYNSNATMLRPFLDDDVAWNGTNSGAWDEYTQQQYPSFVGWNEISRQLLTDDNPDNDLTPAAAQELFRWQHRRQEEVDKPDYNIDLSLGGPVPLIGEQLGNLRFFSSFRTVREMLLIPLSRPDFKEYFWTLKLNSDISSTMKLTASAMLGKSYNVAQNEAGLDNSTQYLRSANDIANVVSNYPASRATNSRIFSDSYFSTGEIDYSSFSLKLTHTLSSESYYDLRLEYIGSKYNVEPIQLRNSENRFEIIPGFFTNEAPFGYSPTDEPGIDGMLTGGHTSTARDFSNLSSTTLKFDYVNQINRYNLLKGGFEFVLSDLDLEYGDIKIQFPEGNTFVKESHSPYRGAFYIQDKLELEGLIINSGLRFDFSDANTKWASAALWDKSFYSSNYTEGSNIDESDSKMQVTVSPRLSISHPITETSKLFFNYGHFTQLPTYEQMMRLSRGSQNNLLNIGNPNLEPEKTISYELGYDQLMSDEYLIQIAGFYRDISNQQSTTSYLSADGSIKYFEANNNLYEDIRGFEATFRKSQGAWWRGFVNYTYQVNTSGQFGRSEVYQDQREQREYDLDARNQSQFRPIPQPYARAYLNFFTPKEYGPQIASFYPFENWNMNVLTDWRSGSWYTWNPTSKVGVSQNVEGKDWFNLNLRFMKTINIESVKLTLFMDINNALNIKRLSLNGFYDVNDYLAYFESLHLPNSNDYSNIVGDDKVGDYRKAGVEFQPIEVVGNVSTLDPGNIRDRAIYYDLNSRKYMDYESGNWSEVSKKRLNKVLDDKAYIDMPNHSYFNFLNPRQIFYGINVSFEL